MTAEGVVLSEKQQRRVLACKAARGVLAASTMISTGPVDEFALIRVAHFILTGETDES